MPTPSPRSGYPRVGAVLYDALIAPATLSVLEPLLDDVARTTRQGGAVVDVGCGGGQVLAALAARRPDLRLTGVDPTPHLVDAAARRVPSATAVRGSALDLPLPDASADVVVAPFSLKEWPDRARGVAECVRVLRPGGRLLVAELHAGAPREQWQRVIDRSRLPGPLASAFVTATLHPVVRRGVSTTELQRLLAAPGLTAAGVEADADLAVAWGRAERAG